jgi:23S rRNA (cytidine2498-2'-O)-methyltransferase
VEGFVTEPGFERALREELGLAGVAVDEGAAPAGLVLTRGPGAPGLDPAFAWQRLPACARVTDTSAARLAKAAFDLIAEPLDRCDHWTLHTYSLPRPADSTAPPLTGRASLVNDALLDLLRRLRRRTDRRRLPADALTQEQAADPTLTLVQVLLLDREAALVSVGSPAPLPTFGVDPEPRWPGAVPPIDDDRGAPSSAYRKAEEAFARLGAAPATGERVVDLGGSPGGWTWTALKRGARVLAIDRAPLEPPVHGHPLLEERQGDAFKFEPDVADGPRDWLLCDVIAAPERTLALLDRWLAEGWCRRFVVNVKFKGDDRRAALAALRDLLARHGARARVKHLVHDKNEVTAFGHARPR